MNKFRNKYRIGSSRLQSWDYRWASAYYITICTKNKERYFGKVDNGIMELSRIGLIANELWYAIPNHSHKIELGEFVVMPDHIHGILVITKCENTIENGNQIGDLNGIVVDSGHALNLRVQQRKPKSNKSIGQQRFQNIGKNSVSSIIGSYKSAVSKHVHRLFYDFQWQPLFYDHLIRNNAEFRRISKYINDNPANWENWK